MRPRRWSGTERAAPRCDDLGVLAQRLGVEAADRRRHHRDVRESPTPRPSSRVSASTAARAAPVCAIAGMPWCGETVTLTTVPAPAGRKARSAARPSSSCPPDVEPLDRAPALGVIDSAGTKYCPPALLTSRSSRPWRSSAASTIAAAWSGSRMSPGTVEQRSPIVAAASSSTSARRPAITTCAPQPPARSPAARPRLVPPPVTIATRPGEGIRREDLRAARPWAAEPMAPSRSGWPWRPSSSIPPSTA